MSTSSLSSPESERESKKVIVNYHDKAATKKDDDSVSEASTQTLSPPRSKSSSDLSEPPEDRLKMEAERQAERVEPTLTSALDPIPPEIATELARDPPPEAVAAPTTEKEVGAGEALIDMAVDGDVLTESPAHLEEPEDEVKRGVEAAAEPVRENDEDVYAQQQYDAQEKQDVDMEVEPDGEHPEAEHEGEQDAEQEAEPDVEQASAEHDERDQEKADDESERQAEDEDEESGENATGGASTAYHVDDEREEALAFLTKLEIEFAMLRNKLYVERMEEVAKESAMIADGTHPELQHLHNILEHRRDTRLSLASVRLKKLEESYTTTFRAEQESAWTNWVEGIKQLHFGQGDSVESGSYGWGYGLQGNDRKRRRLEREKECLEIPKVLRRPSISELAQKANEQHAMLPPPQSISSKKKGKKRGRYPKKDYISEAKQKISMNNWQDVNSSFGEALCSLDDAQIAARAVDEDMMAMSNRQQDLYTGSNRLHSIGNTQQNSPIVSNYPSPTSLPAALHEERPGRNRGFSLDSAPAETAV